MNSFITTTSDVTAAEVSYVEITRTPAAPLRRKTITPRVGDHVEFTSKKGSTDEYRVCWVGTADRNGEVIQRVALRKVNAPSYFKNFFTDAVNCKFIRHGR